MDNCAMLSLNQLEFKLSKVNHGSTSPTAHDNDKLLGASSTSSKLHKASPSPLVSTTPVSAYHTSPLAHTTTSTHKCSFSLFNGSCLLLHSKFADDLEYFLATLAGLSPSQNQRIHYNEIPIATDLALYHSQICYIHPLEYFENSFTLWQMLSFWSKIYNSEHNIEIALDSFELLPYRHQKIAQLSTHLRKRAQLCQVVLSHAPLWLLHEPFAGLDNAGSAILTRLIQARCDQKGLVIASLSAEYSGQIEPPSCSAMWELELSDLGNSL